MLTLGVTGGIGMGKTTAARILTDLGVRVADTDDVAREVVVPGSPALDEIREAFGAGVFESDGTLNRAKLGEVVFADVAARSRLESILHPRIRREWEARVACWRGEGRAAAAVVIPLLFETQAEGLFDAVVCVACSGATQRTRLRERGWSVSHLEQRLAAQMDVDAKIARSRFVVWTEGSLDVHECQWRLILETLGIKV